MIDRNLMVSISRLYAEAWKLNCVLLDNSNLSPKDFPYWQFLREEYHRVLDLGVDGFEFGYGRAGGGCDIRELIAVRETWLNQYQITEDNVIVSGNGVTGALCSVFDFLSRRDRKSVMMPTPIYSGIPYSAEYFGLRPVCVETEEENNFIPTFDDFVRFYGPDVIGVVLTNPSNPVCRRMDSRDIQRVMNFCAERDVYVIIDAIFEEAPGWGNQTLPYFKMMDGAKNLIKVKGVSKDTPHLSDLRIGWSISKNDALNRHLWYFNCMLNSSNSNLSEQIVTRDYLERVKSQKSPDDISAERRQYETRVAADTLKLASFLRRFPLVSKVIQPECGNVLYFKLDNIVKTELGIKRSWELALWIMQNTRVLFTSAEQFLHETDDLWLRMTLCFKMETLEELLNKVFADLERAVRHANHPDSEVILP